MVTGQLQPIPARAQIFNQSHKFRFYSYQSTKNFKRQSVFGQLTYVKISSCLACLTYSELATHMSPQYSGPSILRPPMGPRKCGTHKIALWDQIMQSYNQGGLKIEDLLYYRCLTLVHWR